MAMLTSTIGLGFIQCLDDDLVVAQITDGQREILAVMDEYYYGETGEDFWDSFSGSLTIGAMLMFMGISVGVSIICAWLRCQWQDLLSRANNAATPSAQLLTNRHAHIIARVQDTSIAIGDAPPRYEELFSQIRPFTDV